MGSASAPRGLRSLPPPGPASPLPPFHPQMQVLLAQVQNSEQLLRTLQGTVSQAQERVQLQMVRGLGAGTGGRRVGRELVEGATWKVEAPVLPRPLPPPPPAALALPWSWCQEGKRVSRAPGTDSEEPATPSL